MEQSEAMYKINNLVKKIAQVHTDISKEWENYSAVRKIELFNQKSKKVEDIEKYKLMPIIKEYTFFLSNHEKVTLFDDTDKEFTINSRVKNVNSIEEKYNDYLNYREEQGKVSINKCFNDLFGIRAIIDCEDLSFDFLRRNLAYGYLSLEEKDEIHKKSYITYRATHIYFKKDNKTFRWELQIWRSSDEHSNQESHKNHRFKYKEWESQTKEANTTREE